MSILKLIFLCSALAVVALGTDPKIHDHKVITCKPNYHLAEKLLEKAVGADLSLAAAFVRGAFHDCITTNPKNKGSGCNGSLRLRKELAFRGNRGLDKLMQATEPIVRKTCISNADSLQIGLEVAMKLTGGPAPNLGRGKGDAAIPDPLQGELPGNVGFTDQKAFFERKGFNVQEMVVSDVAGHSLGRFFGRQFTNEPNKFDNKFAINLLRIAEKQTPFQGFNTLNSDLAMNEEEGLQWVRRYADPGEGLQKMKEDFSAFLVKQSQLLI